MFVKRKLFSEQKQAGKNDTYFLVAELARHFTETLMD